MSVPNNISELIESKYEEAVNNKHIEFVESASTKVTDKETGMKYVVSLTPSLNKKPERADTENSNKDPFAELEPELTVLNDLTGNGRYKLVLNKFPITPEHSLLVTNEFEHQTSALTPEDLITAYRIVSNLDKNNDERHIAFYNSGVLSGSSQDHKHLQVLKLPKNFLTLQDSLTSGRNHFIPTTREEPLQNENVSFAHFAVPLPASPQDVDEDLLAMCYISMLQRALTFFQDWAEEKHELKDRGSYNVIITKNWMSVVPRSSAHAKSMNIGFNATAYTGLVLVKQQEVYDRIQSNPSILNEVLLECGFPSTSGEKTNEYNY